MQSTADLLFKQSFEFCVQHLAELIKYLVKWLLDIFAFLYWLLCYSFSRQGTERDFGPGSVERLLWPGSIAPKRSVWGGRGRRASCSSWIVRRADSWSRSEPFSEVLLHQTLLFLKYNCNQVIQSSALLSLNSFSLYRNWNNWRVHRAHCSGNNRGETNVLLAIEVLRCQSSDY